MPRLNDGHEVGNEYAHRVINIPQKRPERETCVFSEMQQDLVGHTGNL